jgi:hypothetical protein
VKRGEQVRIDVGIPHGFLSITNPFLRPTRCWFVCGSRRAQRAILRFAQLPSAIARCNFLTLQDRRLGCQLAHRHKFLGRPADFSSLKPDLCYADVTTAITRLTRSDVPPASFGTLLSVPTRADSSGASRVGQHTHIDALTENA